MAAQLDTILDAVVARVAGLGLALTGTVPVVKRKLPKREEKIDPSEQITVSGEVDLDEMRPIAFGVYQVRYRVEVTLICPNRNDQLAHLPAYLQFREQVRQLFRKPPLAGASAVIDLDYLGGDFLNRDDISKGYDYQQVAILVTTIEQ